MANSLSEFYSGSMLSPNRVGNTLQQAQVYGSPSTLAQIYAGILPAAASTADGVGEGVGWGQFQNQFGAVVPHASGTLIANKDQSRLPSDPVFAYTGPPPAPGLDAIGRAVAPVAPIASTDWSVANPGDGGLFGVPAQGRFAGDNSSPPLQHITVGAPPPPPTPIQSLAAMFTPHPVPQGPGPNGTAGAGTVYNNPTKYGVTQQARNASANARQSFLASWNSG